jgi:hypothetical protein
VVKFNRVDRRAFLFRPWEADSDLSIALTSASSKDTAMLTLLRRITSCFFLTLCILSTVLWARSFFYSDLAARLTGYSQATIESIRGIVRGEIYFGKKRFNTYTDIVYQFRSHETGGGPLRYDDGIVGFFWKHDDWKGQHRIEYRFPFWPFVLALVSITFMARAKPRFHYSLFDLLAVLSMMAIALGIVVSITNASGLYGY